jgi:hypothetical protein
MFLLIKKAKEKEISCKKESFKKHGKTVEYFSGVEQYFSYIMATRFSGGRSRSTRREPPTMGKQMVNFITCCCESSALFHRRPRETF